MTATELVARCRALGVDLSPDPAGTLTWEAEADPPADLLADVAANKVELLQYLTSARAETCHSGEDGNSLPSGNDFPAGPLWVLLPRGDTMMCDRLTIPTEAAYWCRPGDTEWKSLHGKRHAEA